jgi:hypothetical protein
MAEDVDQYDQLPDDVTELMKEAREIVENTLKRVEKSAKKYGAAYELADISAEFDQEVLDIVGWSLLEAVRIHLVLSKKLAQLDGKYLEKFLKYHDAGYLKMLEEKIAQELKSRG